LTAGPTAQRFGEHLVGLSGAASGKAKGKGKAKAKGKGKAKALKVKLKLKLDGARPKRQFLKAGKNPL